MPGKHNPPDGYNPAVVCGAWLYARISTGMKKLKMTEDDYAQLSRVFRKVDFFAEMTVGQLDQVLPYISFWQFAKGERIFKQGEKGDAFYVIYEGSVCVRIKKGFFGFSKEVVDLGPGDFFGEMALLSNESRNATIVCEQECKVFVLMSADFKSVMRRNPSFTSKMMEIAKHRKYELHRFKTH